MGILFSQSAKYDVLLAHFGENGNVGAFIKDKIMPNSKLFCMFHGADIRKGIKKGGHIYNYLF